MSAGLLCRLPDPAAALAEPARVIRPGGELRFYEHVASPRPRAARLQRALDPSGVWAHAMVLDVPVAPTILGRARRR